MKIPNLLRIRSSTRTIALTAIALQTILSLILVGVLVTNQQILGPMAKDKAFRTAIVSVHFQSLDAAEDAFKLSLKAIRSEDAEIDAFQKLWERLDKIILSFLSLSILTIVLCIQLLLRQRKNTIDRVP